MTEEMNDVSELKYIMFTPLLLSGMEHSNYILQDICAIVKYFNR